MEGTTVKSVEWGGVADCSTACYLPGPELWGKEAGAHTLSKASGTVHVGHRQHGSIVFSQTDNGGSKGSESDTVASLLPKPSPVSSPFLYGGLESSPLPFPDSFALDLIVVHYSFVQWNSSVSLKFSLGFSPQKLNDVEQVLWASSFLTHKTPIVVFLKMCSAGYQFHWRSQKKKKKVLGINEFGEHWI